jgi:hypothetical protein
MTVTYTYKMFANAPSKMANGLFDWDTNAIKVALFSSSYVPNQQTDILYSSLTNEVSNGDGYTTGGAALATKTNVVSALTTVLDAVDTAWTAATFTMRVAVIYDTVTSALLGYILASEDCSVTSGTFTIQWPAAGIANIVVA